MQIIVVEEEPVTADEGRDRATEQPVSKRTLGSLGGLLYVPEDFDAPLPDELQRAFEGEAGGQVGAVPEAAR